MKRSYVYTLYLYYVLVGRFLRRYQTVHSASSRASTWSILGTLTVILSLHSSFVAPSLLRFTTWRRLLRNLYRFAFQILCQLFETEKSLSPFLRDFRGKYQGYAWSTVGSDAAPRENLSTTLLLPAKKRRGDAKFHLVAGNAVWQGDRLQCPIKIVASAIVIHRVS